MATNGKRMARTREFLHRECLRCLIRRRCLAAYRAASDRGRQPLVGTVAPRVAFEPRDVLRATQAELRAEMPTHGGAVDTEVARRVSRRSGAKLRADTQRRGRHTEAA